MSEVLKLAPENIKQELSELEKLTESEITKKIEATEDPEKLIKLTCALERHWFLDIENDDRYATFTLAREKTAAYFQNLSPDTADPKLVAQFQTMLEETGGLWEHTDTLRKLNPQRFWGSFREYIATGQKNYIRWETLLTENFLAEAEKQWGHQDTQLFLSQCMSRFSISMNDLGFLFRNAHKHWNPAVAQKILWSALDQNPEIGQLFKNFKSAEYVNLPHYMGTAPFQIFYFELLERIDPSVATEIIKKGESLLTGIYGQEKYNLLKETIQLKYDHRLPLMESLTKNYPRNTVDPHPEKKLLADPLLRGIEDIQPEWISDSKTYRTEIAIPMKVALHPEMVTNFMAVITRNLNLAEKPITKANVEAYLEKLGQRLNQLKGIPLFKDCDIYFLAHGEHQSGLPHYGRPGTLKVVRDQGGNLPEENIFRPDENASETEIKKVKDTFLTAFSTRDPSRSRFMFSGHGNRGEIFLSKGQVGPEGEIIGTDETNLYISVREFFEAYKVANPIIGRPEVFFNFGCLNSNFIRSFMSLCSQENIPKPIFYGSTEFNLYAYSLTSIKPRFENDDLNMLLSGHEKIEADWKYQYLSRFYPEPETLTLKDLLRMELLHFNSNMVIYADDGEGGVMQLTENEHTIEPTPEAMWS